MDPYPDPYPYIISIVPLLKFICLYVTGSKLGWKVGAREGETEKIMRPYICEINKSQIYRIIGETRGYGEYWFTRARYIVCFFLLEKPEDMVSTDSQEPDILYYWRNQRIW